MNRTNIPWADFTWNPTTGCTFGCEWCYARKVAARFAQNVFEIGDSRIGDDDSVPVAFHAVSGDTFPHGFTPTMYPHRLTEPLRRKKPSTIFLGSMGDVFDPAIPDVFRDRIFATVAAAQQHTFVVLTKRAAAMKDYMESRMNAASRNGGCPLHLLPNLVLGVSVTNQADANERIPLLLDTPAARHMVSVEPMMGPVSLSQGWADWLVGWTAEQDGSPDEPGDWYQANTDRLDFVAVGGKTPGRPLHEQTCKPKACGERCQPECRAESLRSLRDQCAGAGVSFHYKHGGTNPPLDGVVYDAALRHESEER